MRSQPGFDAAASFVSPSRSSPVCCRGSRMTGRGKSMRRRGFWVLFGLLLALSVAGTSLAASSRLYVSREHGSDANPCSASMPCRTIGHAVDVAPAGATIHVDKGTYGEQVSITKSLTLEGENAVIDATGQTGGIIPPLVGYGLLVSGPGASGSVVDGFTVEHAIGEGILVAGTSNVRIAHNTVKLTMPASGPPTRSSARRRDPSPVTAACTRTCRWSRSRHR